MEEYKGHRPCHRLNAGDFSVFHFGVACIDSCVELDLLDSNTVRGRHHGWIRSCYPQGPESRLEIFGFH